MKKRVISFLTALVIMLTMSGITAYAGTSFSTATTIRTGTYYTNITQSGTSEYYAFTPDVTGVYSIYSTGSVDTYGTLYNNKQEAVISDDDSGDSNNFYITRTLYAGVKYYIASCLYGGATGSFYTVVRLDYETKDISGASVTLSSTKYTYNGSAKRPGVTVVYFGAYLDKDIDYTVSYKNNTNAGKATVTITGIGAYSGKITKNFTITKKNVKSVIMRGVTYNGKAKVPAVYYNKTVKEVYDGETYTYKQETKYKKGRDYTIKISGKHKQVGTYTATIKFKGNYKGTVKKKFTIHPRYVTKSKGKALSTSEVKVSWGKAKNVSGYKIYRRNANGDYKLYKTTTGTSCTLKRASSDDNYVYYKIRCFKKVGKKTYYNLSYYDHWNSTRVKPSAPKFTISRTNFGEFTVNFSKYDSYEYQCSKYKDFKVRNMSCDVSTWRGYTNCIRSYNLNSGQKYYVRARVYYYDDNGNLKVGPWSKVKAVTPY